MIILFGLEAKDTITIGISLFALIISLINFIRDRKTISVDITKKKIVKHVQTQDGEEVFPNQTSGVGVEFRFLNTSKYPIGFFDITFRDAYTDEILPCLYLLSLRTEIAQQELFGITIDDEFVHLTPLYSNYGIVNSHSYKLSEVIVYPKSEKIRITIKFALFTINPNRYSKTKRFSKWKSKVIELTPNEIEHLLKN